MSPWLIAAVAGVLAFGLKALVPVAAGEHRLPPRVVALTALVAPAVIGALLTTSLATSGMTLDLVRRLAVLAVAFAVGVRSGSFPLTIGAGLGAYLLLSVLT